MTCRVNVNLISMGNRWEMNYKLKQLNSLHPLYIGTMVHLFYSLISIVAKSINSSPCHILSCGLPYTQLLHNMNCGRGATPIHIIHTTAPTTGSNTQKPALEQPHCRPMQNSYDFSRRGGLPSIGPFFPNFLERPRIVPRMRGDH